MTMRDSALCPTTVVVEESKGAAVLPQAPKPVTSRINFFRNAARSLDSQGTPHQSTTENEKMGRKGVDSGGSPSLGPYKVEIVMKRFPELSYLECCLWAREVPSTEVWLPESKVEKKTVFA